MLPRRVFNGLKYGGKDKKGLTWAEMKRRDSNWSKTSQQMETRFKTDYEKLRLFVQKAPREYVFSLLTETRLLDLVAGLLSDPEAERLNELQYAQAQIANKLESEVQQIYTEIAHKTTERLDTIIKKRLNSKRNLTRQELGELTNKIAVENRERIKDSLLLNLEPKKKAKYLEYLRENTKKVELENEWKEYKSRPDVDRISLVNSLLAECLTFGKSQVGLFVDQDITSLVEPAFQSKVEEQCEAVQRLFYAMLQSAKKKKRLGPGALASRP